MRSSAAELVFSHRSPEGGALARLGVQLQPPQRVHRREVLPRVGACTMLQTPVSMQESAARPCSLGAAWQASAASITQTSNFSKFDC